MYSSAVVMTTPTDRHIDNRIEPLAFRVGPVESVDAVDWHSLWHYEQTWQQFSHDGVVCDQGRKTVPFLGHSLNSIQRSSNFTTAAQATIRFTLTKDTERKSLLLSINMTLLLTLS